jgi:hypothetical protein
LLPLNTWYQFGQPTADHNEACGQNATASCLVGASVLKLSPNAPLEVDGWFKSQEPRWRNLWPGWNGLNQDGTMPEMIIEAIQHFCSDIHPRNLGRDVNAIERTIQSGRYVIPLMTSDNLGRLMNYPGHTGHWVAAYNVDTNGYSIANSGTGQDETHARGPFVNSFRGIVIDTGLSDAMGIGGGVMTIDVARGIIEAILGAFGFNPPAGDQIESYAAQIARGANVETVVSNCIHDCFGDGRCWPKRLAAIEDKLNMVHSV